MVGTFSHIMLTERTLIQLKFGPTIHCSKWYEDRVYTCTITLLELLYRYSFTQRMATYLDQDIKRCLTDIVNDKCNCSFQTSHIDKGEFSCRTIKDGDVIYRFLHLTKTNILQYM